MPSYHLIGGPQKVKIHNNSDDKDITKVKVGVVPVGGTNQTTDTVDFTADPIQPTQGEVLDNTQPPGPTKTVCVSVHYDSTWATCCCTDSRLAAGINEVVATFTSSYTLNLWVRPYSGPSRAFACDCGEVPQEESGA